MAGPSEATFIQSFGATNQTAPIPEEDFQTVASLVAKGKQVTTERTLFHLVFDQRRQSVKSKAHVSNPGGQVNPGSWTDGPHYRS